MFYIKSTYKGKPIELEIFGDEIFTKCFKCGKEMQVEEDLLKWILADGGDLESTSISCCETVKPTLVRIK